MHNKNHLEASLQRSPAAPVPGGAARPSPIYPPVIKIAYRGNERVKFSDTCRKTRNARSAPVDNAKAPPTTRHPKNRSRKSNEPSTAGARERRLKARPPARFSSLRNPTLVNQKQEPSGNTLLAQRYPSRVTVTFGARRGGKLRRAGGRAASPQLAPPSGGDLPGMSDC